MSYFRRPLGDDGPITQPSQVDDTVTVGTVQPTLVECDALPADSPWKRPGQVCAPSPSLLDYARDLFKPTTTALQSIASGPSTPATSSSTPTTPPTMSSPPSLLLLAVIGGVGYYLMTKKKRA